MIILFGMVIFGGLLVLKEVKAGTATPSVTVGNANPSIGTITLNGGNAITIANQSYVAVVATATLTDTNGYQDLRYATASLYHNASTCGATNQHVSWCYYASGSPACATSSCASNDCLLTCTFNVWFIAIPTDIGAYSANTWKVEIKATDASLGSTTGSTTQELNAAAYIPDAISDINYGTIAPNGTSSEQNTKATNTGNYFVDVQLSGVAMTSGANSIAVGQQKYSSSSNMGDWVGTALTDSPVTMDIILPRGTATTVPDSVEDIYWMIKIPSGQQPGTYSGTNTFTAILGTD